MIGQKQNVNNTVYDHVDQCYKEDEDDDYVVQDVCSALARLLVDVHPSDYEEEDTDNQLRFEFQNPSHWRSLLFFSLQGSSSIASGLG